MSEYVIELKNKNMGELVEALQDNTDNQNVIYEQYRCAADLDLAMKDLKSKEKLIRYYIAVKIGA